MGKHKAPKEYDVTSLEDVEDDDELKTYFLDWAKENKPTQAAFDNLVNKFKELSVAQEEADSINIEAETKSLGPNAQQIIEGVKKWGQGLLLKVCSLMKTLKSLKYLLLLRMVSILLINLESIMVNKLYLQLQ